MGATSSTGVGQGSANKVGSAIKNITINDPHIVWLVYTQGEKTTLRILMFV